MLAEATALSGPRSHWQARLHHLVERVLSVYWAARAPELLSPPPAADRLLEVGCGAGTWTGTLSRHAAFVAAIDIRRERVRLARSDAEARQRDNIGFVVASGEQLPFCADAFDRVISVDVIEHIPDDRQTLREVGRVTRPGGEICLTSLLEERPSYLRKVIFADHLREYTPDGFAELFRQGGLVEVRRFYFYRLCATLAAELQQIVQPSLGQVRLLGVGLRVSLGLLARLDRLLPLGRPGGIGIRARQPEASGGAR
jgi:ubiquinone/menaquinone biosynthesis C-methylase UbiE